MYKQGLIPDPIVSWALTAYGSANPSNINFGAKNSSDYLGSSKKLDAKSKSEGLWQVKYEGSLFTAAGKKSKMLGSSDSEDEYNEDDFVQSDTQRAILNTTSASI